jgi:hypothetical protein
MRVGTPPGEAFSPSMRGTPYVIMQMHYSNPTRATNIVDSSGVRIRVRDVLQPIESGMLWIGSTVDGITIPSPRNAYGVLARTTLPASLPPASQVNPLTPEYRVIATFLHAHLVGTRIWVETTRGGSRVMAPDGTDQLGADNAYDFAMQQYIPRNGTLRASDVLTTRGVFRNTPAYGALVGNTVAAAGQPVRGGEATSDEMLMAFMLYYPRAPMSPIQLTAPTNGFCETGPSAAAGAVACETFT